MKVFTSPETYSPQPDDRSLFLAGGITDCPDWQDTLVQLLADMPVVLLNPRRHNFPIGDPAAAEAQIGWEYRHLRLAEAIVFWFPCETLCPIVLYELGAWSMTDKPLFIGAHPDYKRRQDVVIQTHLSRPELVVVDALETLVTQMIVPWLNAPDPLRSSLPPGASPTFARLARAKQPRLSRGV